MCRVTTNNSNISAQGPIYIIIKHYAENKDMDLKKKKKK